ncbi:hypothetical protein TEA_002354 [Camellia sinensis var. sinensis]|uniref:Uncharacterized protein n=1 Tax=Camellia sinensis var. sinensis TaxID=542762 RepID=A0A4S4EKB9_CAMSN|nr:hypothetical protein TEA_002354 [Camellia sinensis var. sinensis]
MATITITIAITTATATPLPPAPPPPPPPPPSFHYDHHQTLKNANVGYSIVYSLAYGWVGITNSLFKCVLSQNCQRGRSMKHGYFEKHVPILDENPAQFVLKQRYMNSKGQDMLAASQSLTDKSCYIIKFLEQPNLCSSGLSQLQSLKIARSLVFSLVLFRFVCGLCSLLSFSLAVVDTIMNKGFLFNTKMVMRRLSKEGKDAHNPDVQLDAPHPSVIESLSQHRIQAPRYRYVGLDKMAAVVEFPQPYGHGQGKRKRQPWIEDSISNPKVSLLWLAVMCVLMIDGLYLVCFVFLVAVGSFDMLKSAVNVIDAKSMSADPVAVVELPHRVPYGFHALFVTEDFNDEIEYNTYVTTFARSAQARKISF